jgi:predicted phage baseplate assembly protein
MTATCAPGCICDCCLGIAEQTPRPVANPQGLPALRYRVGTYADFLASMLARLGSTSVPVEEGLTGAAALLGRVITGAAVPPDARPLHPLERLTARATDDPAIAFLDAWAVALDVLTFYQERIANEGYLRTATEFRSVLELARLVGYEPRPGAAASTYLAYTLEQGPPVLIRAGSRAQSVPDAGQLPQSFETREDLLAKHEWNALPPRRARPQRFEPGQTTAGRRVWFQGLTALLKPNDPLLLVFDAARGEPFRVEKVEPENAEQRTRVVLQDFRTEPIQFNPAAAMATAVRQVRAAVLAYREAAPPEELARLESGALGLLLEELENPENLSGGNLEQDVIKNKLIPFLEVWLANLSRPGGSVFRPAAVGEQLRLARTILRNFADNGTVSKDTVGNALRRLPPLAGSTASGHRRDPAVRIEQILVRMELPPLDDPQPTNTGLLGRIRTALNALRAEVQPPLISEGDPLRARAAALIGHLQAAEHRLSVNNVAHELSTDPEPDVPEGAKQKVSELYREWKALPSRSLSPSDLANLLARATFDLADLVERFTKDQPSGDPEQKLTALLRKTEMNTFLAVSGILRDRLTRFELESQAGIPKDTSLAVRARKRLAELLKPLITPDVRPQLDALRSLLEALRDAFQASTGLSFDPLVSLVNELATLLNSFSGEPNPTQLSALAELSRAFERGARDYLTLPQGVYRALNRFVRERIIPRLDGDFELPGSDDERVYTDTVAAAVVANPGVLGAISNTEWTNLAEALEAIPTETATEPLKNKLAGLIHWVRREPASEFPVRYFEWHTLLQELRQKMNDVERHAVPVRLLLPVLENVRVLLAEINKALRGLRQDQRLAHAGAYPRVGPWLDELIEELEQFVSDFLIKVPTEDAGATGAAVPATVPSTGGATPPELPDLGKLNKVPSEPPSSPLRLIRHLPAGGAAPADPIARGSAFTDLVPQFTAALFPQLGRSIYTALANVTTERKQTFQAIHALRARSAPFGHNAPPRPILDDKGKVIGQEEWPLAGGDPHGSKLLVSLVVDTHRVDTSKINFDEGTRVSVKLSALGHRTALDGSISLVRNTETYDIPGSDANVSCKVKWLERADNRLGRLDVSVKVTAIVDIPEPIEKTISIAMSNNPNEVLVAGKPLMARQQAEFNVGDQTFDVSLSPDNRLVILSEIRKGNPLAKNVLDLDAMFDQVTPGSYVIVERTGAISTSPDLRTTLVARVESVSSISRADYGMTGKITRLMLDRPWLVDSDTQLSDVRTVTVYLQSEPLPLAGEPYDADIGDVDGSPVTADTVELDEVVGGLPTGRWVVVAGERTDVANTAGVKASELAMLAGTSQVVDAPDTPGQGRPHTILHLAAPLAYAYQRGTVTVYGNVAAADQGETVAEVLGSGDASTAGQRFGLKQRPLTHVAAPVPSGVVNTLRVRVHDVLWSEAEHYDELGPDDRRYLVLTDAEGAATVVFGDGEHGARLPTGMNNVRATYRYGMGRAGNLDAGKITQLATRPLGVREVTNPVPAGGGADRESTDQARRNAARGVTALGRLVSVQDYADFARGFAGVAKAHAVRLSDGRGQRVFLTVSGPDGEPIAERSDLFRNLREALGRNGDPFRPVTVANLRPLLIVFVARLRTQPEYEFEPVVLGVRDAVFDAFNFDRRDFGQPVYLSELVTVVQGVAGVASVAVDRFALIKPPETLKDLIAQVNKMASDIGPLQSQLNVAGPRRGPRGLEPAEVAFLTRRMEETLILNEMPP